MLNREKECCNAPDFLFEVRQNISECQWQRTFLPALLSKCAKKVSTRDPAVRDSNLCQHPPAGPAAALPRLQLDTGAGTCNRISRALDKQ
ncbi:hypothetical protein CEXT_797951 [Caerostris extrusa]|uniref:Uncharacterized protein n=1 Tax=Caerostris extrusa TaxID=172846 RepID=A0AAV4V7Y5_CAEEX|nr:hypothetical protein CEXT_797951 [Caerostris extrusa]